MVYAKIFTFGGLIAIFIFIIRLSMISYVGDVISEQIEPELEKVLNQLNDKIICIPEASSQGVEICINNVGKVIVNGNFEKLITISTDFNDFCNIKSGSYDYQTICILKNINKANKIYLEGLETKKTIIESTKILGYINTLQNLRKPISNGFWIFKKIRYFPI